jgi:hypothetical protein
MDKEILWKDTKAKAIIAMNNFSLIKHRKYMV